MSKKSFLNSVPIAEDLYRALEYPYTNRDPQALQACIQAIQRLHQALSIEGAAPRVYHDSPMMNAPGPSEELEILVIRLSRTASLKAGFVPGPAPDEEKVVRAAGALVRLLPRDSEQLRACLSTLGDGVGFALRLADSAGGSLNLFSSNRRSLFQFLRLPIEVLDNIRLRSKAQILSAGTSGVQSGAGQGKGHEMTRAGKLTKANGRAYISYELAARKLGKRSADITDQEAHNLLKEEVDFRDDKDVPSELTDYELPEIGTWSRQLRKAREALNEQKYTSRRGRLPGPSVVRQDQIERPGREE